MRTICNRQEWNILELFSKNKNQPLHLRGIARSISLGEGPTTRHLNKLVKKKILTAQKEANLKRFSIRKASLPEVFTLTAREEYKNLPYIRKNAIDFYLNALKEKPVIMLLFGSTAKRTAREGSDIDLVTVFNKKTQTEDARKEAEAQTGIKISEFQLTYNEFARELKLKEDAVIQAAIETGFPIYNSLFFYEMLNDERQDLHQAPQREAIPRTQDKHPQETGKDSAKPFTPRNKRASRKSTT